MITPILAFILAGCVLSCSPAQNAGQVHGEGGLSDLVAQVAGYEYHIPPPDFPPDTLRNYDSWTRQIVSPLFRPSEGTPRLIHRTDGTTCDAICTEYACSGMTVRLAQTLWVCILVVDIGEREFATPAEVLELVSPVINAALVKGELVQTEPRKGPPGQFYGIPLSPGLDAPWLADPPEQWRDWHCVATLRWWIEGSELRMSVIKTYRVFRDGVLMPPPTMRRTDIKGNRFWFTPYRDDPPGGE